MKKILIVVLSGSVSGPAGITHTHVHAALALVIPMNVSALNKNPVG
jgi:hypothetical protein